MTGAIGWHGWVKTPGTLESVMHLSAAVPCCGQGCGEAVTNSMREALTSRKRCSTSFLSVYFPVTRPYIVMLDPSFSIASIIPIETSDWLSQ